MRNWGSGSRKRSNARLSPAPPSASSGVQAVRTSFPDTLALGEKRSGSKLGRVLTDLLRQRCEAALGTGVFLTVRETDMRTAWTPEEAEGGAGGPRLSCEAVFLRNIYDLFKFSYRFQ